MPVLASLSGGVIVSPAELQMYENSVMVTAAAAQAPAALVELELAEIMSAAPRAKGFRYSTALA